MDEVVTLPESGGFGLLSRSVSGNGGTAVVLLNAGLIHRIGPFRGYVQLARALATRGVHAFRFDSPRVGDGTTRTATAQAVLAEALTRVQALTGCSRIVVGGICSGADQAWQAAATDSRIGGVLLLDGFARRNGWFRLGQLQLLLRRPWREWPGMVARFRRKQQTRSSTADAMATYREWPAPDAFIDQSRALLERGTRVFALYTGGVAPYLLHRRQLRATFGPMYRHPGMQIDYWPQCDHLFLPSLDRDNAIAHISRWVTSL